MKRKKAFVAAWVCLLASLAAAQDTNWVRTQIGLFEARTNVVILKAYGQIGSIALGQGQLSLRYKRTSDLNTGEKVYGLSIAFETSQYLPEIEYVDDDEIDSLVQAVDYLT
jgi:hypothetical protein